MVVLVVRFNCTWCHNLSSCFPDEITCFVSSPIVEPVVEPFRASSVEVRVVVTTSMQAAAEPSRGSTSPESELAFPPVRIVLSVLKLKNKIHRPDRIVTLCCQGNRGVKLQSRHCRCSFQGYKYGKWKRERGSSPDISPALYPERNEGW